MWITGMISAKMFFLAFWLLLRTSFQNLIKLDISNPQNESMRISVSYACCDFQKCQFVLIEVNVASLQIYTQISGKIENSYEVEYSENASSNFFILSVNSAQLLNGVLLALELSSANLPIIRFNMLIFKPIAILRVQQSSAYSYILRLPVQTFVQWFTYTFGDVNSCILSFYSDDELVLFTCKLPNEIRAEQVYSAKMVAASKVNSFNQELQFFFLLMADIKISNVSSTLGYNQDIILKVEGLSGSISDPRFRLNYVWSTTSLNYKQEDSNGTSNPYALFKTRSIIDFNLDVKKALFAGDKHSFTFSCDISIYLDNSIYANISTIFYQPFHKYDFIKTVSDLGDISLLQDMSRVQTTTIADQNEYYLTSLSINSQKVIGVYYYLTQLYDILPVCDPRYIDKWSTFNSESMIANRKPDNLLNMLELQGNTPVLIAGTSVLFLRLFFDVNDDSFVDIINYMSVDPEHKPKSTLNPCYYALNGVRVSSYSDFDLASMQFMTYFTSLQLKIEFDFPNIYQEDVSWIKSMLKKYIGSIKDPSSLMIKPIARLGEKLMRNCLGDKISMNYSDCSYLPYTLAIFKNNQVVDEALIKISSFTWSTLIDIKLNPSYLWKHISLKGHDIERNWGRVYNNNSYLNNFNIPLITAEEVCISKSFPLKYRSIKGKELKDDPLTLDSLIELFMTETDDLYFFSIDYRILRALTQNQLYIHFYTISNFNGRDGRRYIYPHLSINSRILFYISLRTSESEVLTEDINKGSASSFKYFILFYASITDGCCSVSQNNFNDFAYDGDYCNSGCITHDVSKYFMGVVVCECNKLGLVAVIKISQGHTQTSTKWNSLNDAILLLNMVLIIFILWLSIFSLRIVQTNKAILVVIAIALLLLNFIEIMIGLGSNLLLILCIHFLKRNEKNEIRRKMHELRLSNNGRSKMNKGIKAYFGFLKAISRIQGCRI